MVAFSKSPQVFLRFDDVNSIAKHLLIEKTETVEDIDMYAKMRINSELS